MNTLSHCWNGETIKARLRAANNSKLRYPLLVFTFVLLAAVAITARQLAEGLVADVQLAVDLLTSPPW